MSPSVSSLQCILRICEAELEWLDMRVNPNKSSCVRFGVRYSIKCRNILTNDNNWFGAIVLDIWSAKSFACSYSYAKKGMYQAFNAVFGKVERVASPDVVVQLVKTKCLPILYYAIVVCPINKSDIFTFNTSLILATDKYSM